MIYNWNPIKDGHSASFVAKVNKGFDYFDLGVAQNTKDELEIGGREEYENIWWFSFVQDLEQLVLLQR